MNFGPHTVLNLTVDSCRTLPDVKVAETGRDIRIEIDEAKKKVDGAIEALNKAWEPMIVNAGEGLGDGDQAGLGPKQREYIEKGKLVTEAEEELKKLKECLGDKDTVRPNAFVTVTLDEDDPGVLPIIFTHTYKGDKRPLWNETVKDIPIGLLAHGKWGRQLLSGTQSPYCPTRLNFWIYHDNGADKDEDVEHWKRDSPQRNKLIGRACLSFGSLVCNGSESWHELAVLDCLETPIPGCQLRVKTQMCTSVPDAALLMGPIGLPGGLICGKPSAGAGCGCALQTHSTPDECDTRFERPSHRHRKKCQSKTTCKSTRKGQTRHVHYHD